MKKHFSTTTLSSTCAQLKLAAVAVTCLLIGCLGSAPRVKPPDVDPTQAAEKAIEAYDQDGDRQLSSNEMAACPGIAMAAGSYDRDGDGNIGPPRYVRWFIADFVAFVLGTRMTLLYVIVPFACIESLLAHGCQ